jgi:hypothetical protein
MKIWTEWFRELRHSVHERLGADDEALRGRFFFISVVQTSQVTCILY